MFGSSTGGIHPLVSCINHKESEAPCTTTWDDMLSSKPPCLRAHRVWQDPASTGDETQTIVTLVTQLSLSRLTQLKAQCTTWLGPLSASVYVSMVPRSDGQAPSAAKVDEMLNKAEGLVDDSFKQLLSLGKCQPRLLLLYEVLGDKASSVLYPVNSLRNYARLLSTTPLIANIDVDMLPSLSLSRSLLKENPTSLRYIRGSLEENKIYVIPAFETTCGGPSLADKVSLLSKDQINPDPTNPSSLYPKCLSIFRSRVAPACHNATDLPRWFSGKDSDPYPIEYQEEFEPWYIGGKLETPWFDTRYRGYGKNKISQVAAAASPPVSSKFHVHPTGFLVHRAHAESSGRKDFLRVKFKSRHDAKLLDGSLYSYIETIWNESKTEMREGRYKPRLDPALIRCLDALSWCKKA